MKTLTKPNIREQVIALLLISEETFAGIVEQLGYDFAWHYTMHDDWSVKYLTFSKSYWNWWKSQWNLRDELFLLEMEAYKNTGSENILMDMWLDHHSPKHVASYPDKFILQEAYQLMLEEVNKEKEGQLSI